MNPEVLVDIIHRHLRKIVEHPPKAGELLRGITNEMVTRGANEETIRHWVPCVSWYIAGWSDAFYGCKLPMQADIEVKTTIKDWKSKIKAKDRLDGNAKHTD